MPMRFRAAATASLLAGLLYPLGSIAGPGPADCGTGSYIAGTVDYCDGELDYRDYVYDDYGARGTSQPPSTGALSNPTGTESYPNPDHNTVNNYADIAAIRLRASGGQLLVSFELNSLFDATSTVVALAIVPTTTRRRVEARGPIRSASRTFRRPRCRSRGGVGTSCICSRRATRPRTGSRGRSRCRPARTGGSKRSRPSPARAR